MDPEELADELGVKPQKLAARIRLLGLGDLEPGTAVTREQEFALRAAFPPSNGRRKVAAVVGGTLALVAAVAFFMSQSSSAEDRREDLSKDLAAWEEAPPATVAPDVQADVTFPPDAPRDREKFCATWKVIGEEEASAPDIDGLQKDFTAYRKWASDRTVWRAAIDEAAAAGPANGVPAHRAYRDMQLRYYAALVNASDSELRSLADGIELNDLENWQRDGDNAVRDLRPHVSPHCNGILG